jgi:hypothetical protein
MIGNYYLLLKFGDVVIPLSTSMLRELTIVQDYNKFLPEFRLRIDDATGAFTHLAPFDRNMSSVYIEFALSQDNPDKNAFSFLVYIREPSSNQSTPSSDYDVTGLLDIPKLFTPDFTRGFSGSIKTTLEGIATNEFGVSQTNVSLSLDYDKNLIQPNWTNAQFLNYLKDNLIGSSNEYGYKSFITSYKYKTLFITRSISEMIADPITYKFILDDKPYQDQNPVLSYYIYDNYKLYGVFGAKQQGYTYYDYLKGVLVDGSDEAQNYTSLSDYFLIDQSDTTDSDTITDTGSSNDFTSDFLGRIKSNYGNRLVSLAKMWITTMGLPNITPGQTVQIFFPHGTSGNNLFSYQYSGFWLVERVVHNMGDVFLTKLLLTRHGLDTDKATSLVKATQKKKA